MIRFRYFVYCILKLFPSPDVSMLGDDGSDDEVSMSSTQECTSTSQSQNQGVSATGELERNSYLSCISHSTWQKFAHQQLHLLPLSHPPLSPATLSGDLSDAEAAQSVKHNPSFKTEHCVSTA